MTVRRSQAEDAASCLRQAGPDPRIRAKMKNWDHQKGGLLRFCYISEVVWSRKHLIWKA